MGFQFQWCGPQLINLRYLAPTHELDEPSEFLRTIVLPPDPVPILNARIENYAYEETSNRALVNGDQRITQSDEFRIVQIADDSVSD